MFVWKAGRAAIVISCCDLSFAIAFLANMFQVSYLILIWPIKLESLEIGSENTCRMSKRHHSDVLLSCFSCISCF